MLEQISLDAFLLADAYFADTKVSPVSRRSAHYLSCRVSSVGKMAWALIVVCKSGVAPPLIGCATSSQLLRTSSNSTSNRNNANPGIDFQLIVNPLLLILQHHQASQPQQRNSLHEFRSTQRSVFPFFHFPSVNTTARDLPRLTITVPRTERTCVKATCPTARRSLKRMEMQKGRNDDYINGKG